MSEETKIPSPETEPPEDVAPKPRKKRGYLKYSPLSLILLSVCAFVFSFSLLGIFEQSLLDSAGESVQENLSNLAFPELGESDGDVIAPLPYPDLNAWQSVPVTEIDPQTLPFLQTVDFAALKAENSDTVAWMYFPTTADVKGLPINLPVVQTSNNNYYLTHSFDHSYSDNGWVYADSRNNLNNLNLNRNFILYGHARSYRIFGGLKYLNNQHAWQQDGYNHFIYINTPYERTVWQLFSWYETTIDFNYISTSFSDGMDYVSFLNTLQEKNTIAAFEKFEFSPTDRILTLSTCKGTDENVRVAVHAVLVKHEWVSGMEDIWGADHSDMTDGAFTDVVTDEDFGDPASSSGSGGASDPNVSTDTGTPTDQPTDVTSDGSASTDSGMTTDSSDGAVDSSGESSEGGSDSGATDTGAPPDTGSTDTETPPDTGSSDTDAPTDSGASDSGEATDAPTDSSDPSSGASTDSGAPSDTGSDGDASSENTDTSTPADTSSAPVEGGDSSDTGTPGETPAA